MSAELMVTSRHLAAAQLCSRGARQWFALHKLDYTEFVCRGIPASRLEALHDALADKVVRVAREELEEGGA